MQSFQRSAIRNTYTNEDSNPSFYVGNDRPPIKRCFLNHFDVYTVTRFAHGNWRT